MANKRERHRAIRALIEERSIGSQEELRVQLEAGGWHVTQATLSRDLSEMGIARVPGDNGPRYFLPDRLGEDAQPSLEGLLPQMFESIDGVGELLVLHTVRSGAQPVAEAIDAQEWREVLGTIAGDDTVLIICRSAADRAILTDRLEELAGDR